MDEQNYAEMVVPDTSEDDYDRNDKDFDPLPSHKIGSSKLGNASMSGNVSKRLREGVNATKSNMMEVKKRSKRLWSQNDELRLLKGFKDFNTLDSDKSMSFYSYIKDAISVNCSPNQLSKKLGKLKSKYQKTKSRMKEPNFTFGDSHQQKLFEASSKIWKEKNEGSKSDELSKEGKDDEDFYSSLLRDTLADGGLDFASLDQATQSILVEDWNDLMLARSTYELLKATFDKKIYECKCNVYEAHIRNQATPKHS